MPSRNKSIRSKSLLSALNPNTKFKQLLVFMLVFAVLGGGYYLYKSHAASYPPESLRLIRGPASGISCVSAKQNTSGGVAWNCLRISGSGYVIGYYNISNRSFTPTSGQYSSSSYDGRGLFVACGNMDNYFMGVGAALNSGFGPLYVGYIYLYAYNVWFAKQAVYFPANRTCNPTGAWFDVSPW